MSISSEDITPGEWHSTTRRKPHYPPCDGRKYWGPCLEGELEVLRNVLYKLEYPLEYYTWVKSHNGPTIWRYKVSGRKVSYIALCLLLFYPGVEKSWYHGQDSSKNPATAPVAIPSKIWILFSFPLILHYSLLAWQFNVPFYPILWPTQPQGGKLCLLSLRSSWTVCGVYAKGLKLPLQPWSPKNIAYEICWLVILSQ